ncbi:FkbM family methyltransferase [Parahaliea sp. F7430]|uniref:FkbM family methyltransferase n=2 Tax=Sediminihaliea albiluteola TaxID=2758564 RepID=A0A7W2TU24_9GAMM|nr:FkbM family methyltransferase [Sediminihaliea albiluteola]
MVDLRVPGLSRSIKLQVHGPHDRCISRQLIEQGIWEPYETQLLLGLLKPGDVFVDVGANIGYFTVLAAERVGSSGKVFAFEPAPDNFALLLANVRDNGFNDQVEALAAGLGSESVEARLHLSEDNLGDHQLFATEQARHSVPVSLLCGAQYLATRLSRIDMLKVDTQGFEFQVIEGLLPLLLSLAQPPQILIELTPLSLRQAGSSGRALIELLAKLQQPWWIVDHIEHQLVASDAAALAQWCDNVDACAGDAGFMNILVGPGLV